jgi:hypothetical protein
MKPGDRWIGQAQVVRRRLADADLLAVDQAAQAAARSGHHRQAVPAVGRPSAGTPHQMDARRTIRLDVHSA